MSITEFNSVFVIYKPIAIICTADHVLSAHAGLVANVHINGHRSANLLADLLCADTAYRVCVVATLSIRTT